MDVASDRLSRDLGSVDEDMGFAKRLLSVLTQCSSQMHSNPVVRSLYCELLGWSNCLGYL